jgi:putative ABC transport system ATP-binding protein
MSTALMAAAPQSPGVAAMRAALPLVLRDIRVTFADAGRRPRVVLDVPELTIAGGAQVAILGPSGSGKTTLLNVLAGIECAQRGTVRWGALDIGAMPPRAADRWRRQTLGFVFQQFHLFPGMSALDNVLLPLRFDRFAVPPAHRERACELLERVGVDTQARFERLSRGEMQRAAVARALVKSPAIVLADEPTASLDRDTAAIVADLLCHLCREQHATLVVATHDTVLAERLDRRFVLGAPQTANTASATASTS